MVFADFRYRYAILAANEALSSGLLNLLIKKWLFLDDLQTCSNAMLKKLVTEQKLSSEEFRVGRNKVFFRAGILAKMEEYRDAAISIIITKFQCTCRAYLAQIERHQREILAEAVETIQWDVRKWLDLRKSDW
jgi:myosin heavy subunit